MKAESSVPFFPLNDVFRFDTNSLIWTDLTPLITGSAPPPSVYSGFVSALDALFVWGGMDSKGKARLSPPSGFPSQVLDIVYGLNGFADFQDGRCRTTYIAWIRGARGGPPF